MSLARLERLRAEYGPAVAAEKLRLLQRLEKTRLKSAPEVMRLHELALWLLAYPDDAGVHRAAQQLLDRFHQRRDLVRFAEDLADSGIAGTPIYYRLFWPLARWLMERAPERLRLDWAQIEDTEALERWLPRLLPASERAAAAKDPRPIAARLQALAGAATDASFLVRQLTQLPAAERVQENLHDDFDHSYRLDPGPRPSRTQGRLPIARIQHRRGPLHAGRPDLAEALRRLPAPPKDLHGKQAEAVIELAREAMVTRSRDLEVFGFANPEDVCWIDDGEGLAFAGMGFRPDRRLQFHGTYGLITLKNGVPIGYVQLDAALGNAELSFNTFPTFRGGESAWIFARTLAACQRLFGNHSFSIEPYQLGDHNEEAILSGAWWFYAKLGFRPQDRATVALAKAEQAKMARRPTYRSSPSTLRALARTHLYYSPSGGGQLTHVPIDKLSAIGSGYLIGTGLPRAEAEERAVEELSRLTQRRVPKDAGQRFEWRRWAPVLLGLPGLRRWPLADRQGLAALLELKAGRRERDYVRALDGHQRLTEALRTRV